jgi:Flp pilus assembly protein TadG
LLSWNNPERLQGGRLRRKSMRGGFFSNSMRLRRQEHGGVAVEFAILLPVFLVLLFGIIDAGQALYMKQVITSASREGARYATRYQENGGMRVLPNNLSPSIPNYVLQNSAENGNAGGYGLDQLLPQDANAQVSMADLTSPTKSPGYSTTDPNALPGLDITVTVTATKHWWVLGKLIPSLGDSLNLSSSTVMKCE